MLNIKAMAGGMAVAVLVGGVGGFGLGYRVASGGYEKRLHNQAVAYANAQTAAIDEANRAAAAERRRAVSAAEERTRREAGAREVIHDIAANPDDRDCGWTDDQRMRIESLYRAHGYRSDGTADRMPNSLQPAATGKSPENSMGGRGLRLGGELRKPAR